MQRDFTVVVKLFQVPLRRREGLKKCISELKDLVDSKMLHN